MPFLEILIRNCQICYNFLFTLFNSIMVSFHFGKLIKIPKNFSGSAEILVDKQYCIRHVNKISYLKLSKSGIFVYLSQRIAV